MNAAARQARTRREAIRAGTWLPRQPVGPIREHLRTLMNSGMLARDVAKAAGLPLGTVKWAMYGSWPRVDGRTAAALLAVRVPVRSVRARRDVVPVVGAARRLQALMAMGYTAPDLASLLGVTRQRVWTWCIPNRPGIAAEYAARVRDLYDRLSMVSPSLSGRAVLAQRQALARGWAPPLAWDDDTIDDPSAEPQGMTEEDLVGDVDESAVVLMMTGRRPSVVHRVDRAEALRRMWAAHLPVNMIADRLGEEPETTRRALLRLGLRAADRLEAA